MRTGLLALLAAGSLYAQTETLRVYSELTRIGPDGAVVAPDRGGEPRHILSPGVIRGAWASFRVVVQPPGPGHVIVDIGQNPDNSVTPKLYREIFDEHGIPDLLTEVKMPYEDEITTDRKVLTFWLDLWVPRTAHVGRIKVEPELWYQNAWFTYPMEVRILTSALGEHNAAPAAALPAVIERADAATLGPLRQAFCDKAEQPTTAGEPLTARALIRRNVLQHLMIARTNEKLKTALAIAGAENICTHVPPAGPEWYLKVRDFLFGRER